MLPGCSTSTGTLIRAPELETLQKSRWREKQLSRHSGKWGDRRTATEELLNYSGKADAK
jgi:hypothetical protein